jgi:uncharacterized RDD family membrane protein YckC
MTTFREYRERRPADQSLMAPTAALPKTARAFQGERAGIASRAIAAGIDVTLIFVVVLATAAGLWMLSFIVDPSTAGIDMEGRLPDVLYFVIYGYVLNWAYWTVCWATSGRTIGNLVMGVRVINYKGVHQHWGGAALRSLFCTLFPIGLFWVIVSRSNRSIQDVVLRTSVIYDWVVGMPNLAGVLKRKPNQKESPA